MTVVLAEKRCSHCGEVKPLSEFGKGNLKDGRSSWCKPCMNEQAKRWQAERRAEIGEEAWLAYKREQVRASRARTGDHRGKLNRAAYRAATKKLIAAHRTEFDALLRVERYERRGAGVTYTAVIQGDACVIPPFGVPPPWENDYMTRTLWSRIEHRISTEATGCWSWNGWHRPNGYANFAYRDEGVPRTIGVHRITYGHFVGDIPAGYEIDHLCRNRWCANPAHLEAVTHAENMRRAEANTEAINHNSLKTHCPNGHPYDGENLYVSPDGRRRGCRACRLANVARFRDRQRITAT